MSDEYVNEDELDDVPVLDEPDEAPVPEAAPVEFDAEADAHRRATDTTVDWSKYPIKVR